jgi:excisionase family DNA binding protein
MSDEKYITIEQVAEHYQVSISTVRAWIRTGVIPLDSYLKVGKTFRFQLTDVDAAIRAYNTAKHKKLADVAAQEVTPDQDM